jgi:hypothetical protein
MNTEHLHSIVSFDSVAPQDVLTILGTFLNPNY